MCGFSGGLMKSIKSYIIDTIIGIIIAVSVFFYRDILNADTSLDVIMILSDGCFMAGVFLAGFGMLSVLSDNGSFDIIRYGTSVFHAFLRRKKSKERLSKSYYEYKIERAKKSKSIWHLVFTGVFYIVLGGIFVVIFYIYE